MRYEQGEKKGPSACYKNQKNATVPGFRTFLPQCLPDFILQIL
jgi:hypothetical protein